MHSCSSLDTVDKYDNYCEILKTSLPSKQRHNWLICMTKMLVRAGTVLGTKWGAFDFLFPLDSLVAIRSWETLSWNQAEPDYRIPATAQNLLNRISMGCGQKTYSLTAINS